MKKTLLPLTSVLICIILTSCQLTEPDKSMYPGLPDPLVTDAGKKVRNISTWENTRRDEILNIFTDSVYGRSPQPGAFTSSSSVVSTTSIANGTAERKMVRISLKGPKGTHTFEAPVYLPDQTGKVPVFILINHRAPIYETSSTSGFFLLDNVILTRGKIRDIQFGALSFQPVILPYPLVAL